MTAADPLDRREPRQLLAQPEAREMPAIPAAWRERALRGSHRFAPVCRSHGDTTRFAFVPLLRRLPSVLRCLLRRPNRLRFTYQTSEARTCRRFFRMVERCDVCSAPNTRKTQSA